VRANPAAGVNWEGQLGGAGRPVLGRPIPGRLAHGAEIRLTLHPDGTTSGRLHLPLLDGELAPDAARALDAHVATCAPCAARVARYRTRGAALSARLRESAPAPVDPERVRPPLEDGAVRGEGAQLRVALVQVEPMQSCLGAASVRVASTAASRGPGV
jgi:anti-sigma factor RsiW